MDKRLSAYDIVIAKLRAEGSIARDPSPAASGPPPQPRPAASRSTSSPVGRPSALTASSAVMDERRSELHAHFYGLPAGYRLDLGDVVKAFLEYGPVADVVLDDDGFSATVVFKTEEASSGGGLGVSRR